jgi:pyruvate/2-oxoglutarate dehydrogenase complex dihydrolipoamide acyltransferase (E2) component
VKWLVRDGAALHVGTKLVIVETSAGRYAIATNGEGFLREKLFPAGAELSVATPIAVVNADGENIPHGRPYSVAERLL